MSGKPTVVIRLTNVPPDVANAIVLAANGVLQSSGLLAWQIYKETEDDD